MKTDGVPFRFSQTRLVIEFPTGQNLKFLVEQFRPVHGDPKLVGYREENIYHYVENELTENFEGFIKKLFKPVKEAEKK